MALDPNEQLIVDLIALTDRGPEALDGGLERLDEALRSSDEKVRAAASGLIEYFLDPRFVPLLLGVIEDAALDPDRRAAAAISLGPLLEQHDMNVDLGDLGLGDLDLDLGDLELDDPLDPETVALFARAKETLARVHADPEAPKLLRRYALEASIRSPEPWQRDAVLGAWRSGDLEWRITAAFCMGQINGFDEELTEALEAGEPELLREALRSAGNSELKVAAPKALWAAAHHPDRWVRVAAIEALGALTPDGAFELLEELEGDGDAVIVECAEAALEQLLVHTGLDSGFDPDDFGEVEDGHDEEEWI